MYAEGAHAADGRALARCLTDEAIKFADTASTIEHECQSKLRRRDDHRLRRIGHNDAVGESIVDIDVVEADAEVGYQAELRPMLQEFGTCWVVEGGAEDVCLGEELT